MSSGARKVLDDAYALEEDDRALLAAELSEEVEEPEAVRSAWVKVATDRLERHQRGESTGALSLDEVEAGLRASLDER